MKIFLDQNIKRLRLEKQITQEQLAVAMGVSCAAVSKWERGETLPDISLLPTLASYFNISIDQLMGYSVAQAQQEIDEYFEKRKQLLNQGKQEDIIELSKQAYHNHPNDYRVINRYMWDLAGDYADNDPSSLLKHYDEFSSICHRILENCQDVCLRLDAINMKGKLLHAQGKTQQAVELYQTEFPDWYMTCGQKTEQLFAKNTPEFARQLRWNLLELGGLAINKKCKELWYCNDLSLSDKSDIALQICTGLYSLGKIPFLSETDYYIWCFANDMAHKFRTADSDSHIAEQLTVIAQQAKLRFLALGNNDPLIADYCKTFFSHQ